MGAKGVAETPTFTCWNTAANTPALGEVANLTMRVIKDGVAAAAANAPVEVENGEYKILLTAAEKDADFVVVEGSCITANVVVIPVKIQTHPSADDVADEVLKELPADHKAVAGSLAEFINRMDRVLAGKTEGDEDLNTLEIFDTDGITLLVTLTFTKAGAVITRVPS